MRTEKPAKNTVRSKWGEILKEVGPRPGPYPLYLTLPGAEGKDVELLIKEGLISVTETGAIAQESINYCVAIESSSLAVLALQKRFPGLRILEQNIKSVLRGDSILAYPEQGKHRNSCQAHVVNLDLECTLEGSLVDSDPVFPVLRWIEKFGALHSECPHREWHLLLTLNATVEWSEDLSDWICEFLRDNFASVDEFGEVAARLLGAKVFSTIQLGKTIKFRDMALPTRQAVLLILLRAAQ